MLAQKPNCTGCNGVMHRNKSKNQQALNARMNAANPRPDLGKKLLLPINVADKNCFLYAVVDGTVTSSTYMIATCIIVGREAI